MATIEYLWHDHLLHLRSVLAGAEARCFVCLQPVSGYSYRCPKCSFFLHISCLKLPIESLHPLHQKHPLVLLPQPPHNDHNQEDTCNECENTCSGFTYHCATYIFDLHLHCASKQLTFDPEIHKHSLTFSVSPPNRDLSFRCKVCGDLGQNFNLYCQGCQFVVHVECSALPLTIIREQDEHLFILVTTRSVDEEPEEVYCDRVYIAHLGCLTSARKPLVKLSYKDVDPSSVETSHQLNLETDLSGSGFDNKFEFQSYLIDDDELTKLRRRYSELQIMENAQSSQACEELQVQQAEPMYPNVNCNVVELQHFSHQHPLTLNNDHEKDGAHCSACWGRISGVGYGCAQCNYFLHRWCAELPQKIHHIIHSEHTLTLLSRAPPNTYGCNACDEPCDGFTYHCNSCYFNLHAICASIPITLVNEIHQHPLSLRRKRPYSTSCIACGNDCRVTVFQCDVCNLDLDFKCALLPHKVRYKHHRHPLTFSTLVEYDSDEYYCDICEERGDPNYWVYCCLDCEYVAHMNCVVSELIRGPPSTGLLQYDHHERLLNLITKLPFKPS
ncbi:uncharacterized protein LOC132272426 [Cornus florida]|uniref:uncharacterized protein LOC132272426 n=1 Tax=Cornus florida TaxID=4283 RepID=UPI0028987EB0|nr:uncharacterized protein LOC132272426 [Cornus florida]